MPNKLNSLLGRWLRREPRRLEPVACWRCGEEPEVWSVSTVAYPGEPAYRVTCWSCYPIMIGATVKGHTRDDAVRLWNNIHGEVVLDGEEVARFSEERPDA